MDRLQIIELAHQQAHNAAHDFEDTVFVALTRRDCWLIALSTAVVEAPCLGNEFAELLERLMELIEVQKNGWRTLGET